MAVFVSLLDDALVVLGLVIMTVGVYGVVRFPDVYTRLHAASKAVFLGVIAFLAASCLTGGPDVVLRSVLIALFLLVTTPVSAHLVAQSAFVKRVSMRTPGALDESGCDLPIGDEEDDSGSEPIR